MNREAITIETVRAITAMQVAVLEWDNDTTLAQPEARQAINGFREAMNVLNLQFVKMQRVTENKRHSFKG